MAKNSDRRRFLRKVFGLTAMAGIAGILSDRILGNEILPPVQAVTAMNIDTTNTGAATTSLSSPGNPAFTATNTGSGAALQGTATAGTGVLGTTTTGTGVQGTASAAAGIGLSGFAGNAAATPIVAQGSTGQTANLQEWRNSTGTALDVVNSSGNVGIGTTNPVSGLDIALGVARPFLRVAGIAPFPTIALQGAYLSWNLTNGVGETDFINNQGGGQGGFYFINTPAAGTPLSTLMVITGAGNVGIGTTSPSSPLDIFASVQPELALTSTHEQWRIAHVDNSRLTFYRPSVAEYLVILNGGNVGIGTTNPAYLLDVAGQCHATGFPTSSDMRFKSDIEPIDNALDKVLRLNGVYFKWNHLHRDVLKRSNTTAKQVGLIAQQVKEVIPEIVSEWRDKGAENYLAVDYSRLVAIMIEAIKELKTENNKLLNRIAALEQVTGFSS